MKCVPIDAKAAQEIILKDIILIVLIFVSLRLICVKIRDSCKLAGKDLL